MRFLGDPSAFAGCCAAHPAPRPAAVPRSRPLRSRAPQAASGCGRSPPPLPPLEPEPDTGRGVFRGGRGSGGGGQPGRSSPRPAAETPAGRPAAPRAAWHRPGSGPALPAPAWPPPGPDLQPVARGGPENGEDQGGAVKRRHQRGPWCAAPRAPAPGSGCGRGGGCGGTLPALGRQVGAPQAGWGAAPGAGRGRRGGALPVPCRAALPAASPLPGADQTVSAAPEPGCGGSGGGDGGGAGGGPGAGPRLAWRPSGPGHPPPPTPGRAGAAAPVDALARGTGFLPGSLLAGCPGSPCGRSLLLGTPGCVAWLGRARSGAPAARPRPDGDRRAQLPQPAAAGTAAPPLPHPFCRSLGARPRPDRGEPARALLSLERTWAPAALRARGRSDRLRTREVGAARSPAHPRAPPPQPTPTARPLLPPVAERPLWPGPPQVLTSSLPGAGRLPWFGQLNSGRRLPESETSLLAGHKIWARPKLQGVDLAPYLSGLRFHPRNGQETGGLWKEMRRKEIMEGD